MVLFSLFLIFVKIGMFSFGGGYAMLPLIYQAVQDFSLMGAEEFSRLVALSQVTPGPIAVNAATYVGYQYAGLTGAVIGTVGVVFPSIILVLIINHFLIKFKESRGLNTILSGIRPVTIGLLGSAAVFIAQESILTGGSVNFVPLVFCVVVIILNGKWKLDPIVLTIVAGIIGAFVIR